MVVHFCVRIVNINIIFRFVKFFIS